MTTNENFLDGATKTFPFNGAICTLTITSFSPSMDQVSVTVRKNGKELVFTFIGANKEILSDQIARQCTLAVNELDQA